MPRNVSALVKELEDALLDLADQVEDVVQGTCDQDELTTERAMAALNDHLTPEDKKALDALGPDLAGRIARGEPVGEHARLRAAVDAIKAASRDGRLDAFAIDSILCEFGEAKRPGGLADSAPLGANGRKGSEKTPQP